MLELLAFISHYIITPYIYVIIAAVMLQWLMGFGIVNPSNPAVRMIYEAVRALTEPLLRPIRRMMPDLGGLDISPIILVLACQFTQIVVIPNIAKALV
jgi:YggT family protein